MNLEERIAELKTEVVPHPGESLVSAALARHVDELIGCFYDDIGTIIRVDLKSLFDLFLLKTLYINRRGRDPHVLDYLSSLLARFLFARELFPFSQERRRMGYYVSHLLEETDRRLIHFQNLFEAYRRFGDYSLFLTGVFPTSLRRQRSPGRLRRSRELPLVDQSYYVTFGKRYYRLASDHELAEETGQRPVLAKLAAFFEVYMGALNEMSERYILGFDMNLIADKMLDNYNRYRASGDPKYLDNARKYAALLRVDRASFPRLFSLRRRFAPR